VVPVALGVGQPLQKESRPAFAHHKAIRSVPERPRPGRAQRADLAELNESRRAHVAVESTSQHRVAVAPLQQLDGRIERGHARGASRVSDKVGTTQVEHVRDPAGHHVRQLARHGVFRDWRQRLVDLLLPALQHGRPHLSRQLPEFGGCFEGARVFGQRNALRGQIVQLAAHRRAHHHARAVKVQCALGKTVIGESLSRDGHRPLLHLVHGRNHARRDMELFPVKSKTLHPGAYFAVSLVGRSRVGIVVILYPPPVGWHFYNAVASATHILPEG
jgi:hypothetical protein